MNGFSPAQLLMQLKTRLPNTKQFLQQSWPARDTVAASDASYRNFNHHHLARPLPLLESRKRVWVQPGGITAIVLSEGSCLRCYVVETDQGAVLQHNPCQGYHSRNKWILKLLQAQRKMLSLRIRRRTYRKLFPETMVLRERVVAAV